MIRRGSDADRSLDDGGLDDRGLDDRLRSHYASLSLGDDSVKELLAASRTVSNRPLRRPMFWVSVAAMLVLSSLGVHHLTSVSERTERTIREAAMNHGTRLSLDYASSDVAQLDDAMALLPFEIRRPTRLDDSWTLRGGRYCSLAGHLAVHMTLVDASGDNTRSLFVTRAADDLDSLDGERQRVNGVEVQLWGERGLFYAMANDAT